MKPCWVASYCCPSPRRSRLPASPSACGSHGSRHDARSLLSGPRMLRRSPGHFWNPTTGSFLRSQTALHRELPELVSMIRAFTSAGMPLERTLHVLSANQRSDRGLRREIRLALGRYGLGLSIEQALQDIGPRTGLDDVTTFVAALAQSKRIGSGLEATLRDQELMVRLNQRNRATAQAAAVTTKLLAVLGGIYLPEFVILIMIPLFWGIMQRAFG